MSAEQPACPNRSSTNTTPMLLRAATMSDDQLGDELTTPEGQW
jgi:hypothetical protein